MQFGKYSVEISRRDKVFFPGQNITKGDVIDYYDKIADRLLPFLKDRPLTLHRFPEGITKDGFYQKEASGYFPDWIQTVLIEKDDGSSIPQVVCNNKATLIYLANQGTVSFHPWLSQISGINKPDKLIFDLDPPDGDFDIVIKGAKALRSLLEENLKLHTFLMTTGSQGMHVICPIIPDHDFDEVRSFAESICDKLAKENPDLFTTQMRKKNRKGRLFLDYLRNAYAQTSVAPYSLRPLKKAPVAAPLSWEELGNRKLTSQSYNLGTIFKRLSQKENIWDQFRNKATKIDAGMAKLDEG